MAYRAVPLLFLPFAAFAEFRVETASGRPDMISGTSTLIRISGGDASKLRAELNGKSVTAAFRPGSEPGVLLGRVEGLRTGSNVLRVRAGKGADAKLRLNAYPITGPIFSGPHQKPFICQTEAAGLGTPLDADCSAKTVVAYYYRSTEPVKQGAPNQGFKKLDPAAPRPADIAKTAPIDGRALDYIVRRETGTINRAIYDIAFLHEPGQPLPTPWNGTPGWNGRLVYLFGGGCSAGYRQASSAMSALNSSMLSAGYTVAASSLNVFGNDCNDVISAETMMMVKEHFIEQFGAPVYTIGWGGSGGSMQQHLISQNYPGLLDGILPTVSYSDIVTVISSTVDCSLLDRAFESSGQSWTEEQKTRVSGYATWNTCKSWIRSFSPALIRPGSCNPAVPKNLVYDAVSNPKGARCAIYDNQANLFGRDPSTGFARRTLDNVGVQYGLAAFEAGHIDGEQFVTINEKVGGYDNDGNFVAARTMADPTALRAAYEGGRVDSGGGGLGSIPILDSRPYMDDRGDIHDSYRSLATRARLERTNGSAANHTLVTAAFGSSPRWNPLALMDEWLGNIRKSGQRPASPAEVAKFRPAVLADACYDKEGQKAAAGRCREMYPAAGNPRIAAGGPLADDILKCALKPFDPAAYKRPLPVALAARLRAVFPQGVCDYSKPGIEQRPLQGVWRKY